jgi:hypothetical protein
MPEDEAHFHKFQTQFGEFKIDTKADPEFVKKIQNAIKELPEELQNVIKSHSIEVIRGKKINGKFEAGATTFNKGSNITFWDTDNMRKLNNNELKNMLQHEIGHVVDYNSTSRRAYVTKSLKSELGKLGDAEIDELATTIKSSSSHMVKDMDVEKIKELLKSGNISPYPTKIADSLQADREHFAELTAIMFDGNTSKQNREMLPETTEKFYRMIKNTPVEDITRDIPKTVSARDEIIRKLEATKQVIDTFEGADLKHLDKNIEKLDRILSSNEDFEKFFDKEFGAHMPPKTKTVTERVRKTEEVDWTESLPSELREPAKKIKEQFDSWAEEEGLEKIENYVPHVLSYELRKNKKALSKVPEMKMPDNLNELHRKYEGTISEINKTMKEKYDIDNFFDTMIVRSYLERGIKHNKFMFEKEYLDQTLNLFGQRVDKQAFASLSKEQKKALWEDIQTKKKSGEYVFVELGDKYNPVTKKTIDNSEITEGYARRNATREASRLNDSDNPLVDELNQYQINNPFIQIDPRKITEEELFARGENPIYILPKVMHDKYLKTVQKQYGKQKNIIIDMIDRFTHLWKAKATTSASFHATNMMGNTFNSYLSIGSRILDPELNRVAIQIGRGKGSFMGRTGEEWRKILSEYGIGDFTQFSDSVKDFRKGLTDDIMEQNPLRKTIKRINPFSTENVVYKGNQKIGGAIENQAKIVNFIAHVQDGKSLQEASDLVNKFLFDYTDVTDFEQNWMKRIVPFYTWMKKNIPLQFEQIIDNPAKYGRIQRGINSFSQPETDEEKRYKPDYLGDAIHTGHGEYTNVNLPYKDLGKLNPKDMFSSVNPLLKMIAEVGTNTNTYFGSPIKNNEGELVKPTPYQIPFAKDTPNGKMIDPTVKYILDLLNPDFKRFSDIAQSASDGDFEATMGKASGIKKYNVDYEKERKNAMYKYIQKLKELETNSRKQGYIKK